MQERLGTDYDWTERQRQVLSLLVARKTNAEIAAALGITAHGAKWHVGEILSKLQAGSREEAAEYWRRQNGMAPRFARVFRAFIGSAATQWIVGGAVSGVLVAALVLGGLALRGGGHAPDKAADAPATVPGEPTPRTVLSDGTDGYSYEPQLAYVDAGGDAWLSDRDAAGPEALMPGCTRNQTLKAADVFTASLGWSANGERVGCQDSNDAVMSQAAGQADSLQRNIEQCDSVPSWAPDGKHVGCQMSDRDGPRLHIFDTQGSETGVIENLGPTFSWSPSGTSVLTMLEPTGNHVTFGLSTVEGARVTTILYAYASVSDIQWIRDGSRLAYPGADGLVVVDTSTGDRKVIPRDQLPPAGDAGQDLWTGGIHVDWVLHNTALLVHRYTYAALVDLSNSKVTELPTSFGNVSVAPDGVHGWTMVGSDDGAGWQAAFVDIETRAAVMIPGSEQRYTMSAGPSVIFSGDSKKACWAPSPNNSPDVFCASVAGGPAVEVTAPVQVEPDALGSGDLSILWRAFSPDLTKVAYTIPGPTSPGAQTLWVSNLDGTDATSLGPAIGAIPYRWRPDGVYRSPARFP